MSFVPSPTRTIFGGMKALLVLAMLASVARAAPKPPIKVAFVISDGAVMIDFAGPWAVFENVRDEPFQLYTVAESTAPIHASSGMTIVPDYTFATAPKPNIIVVPAQSNHGKPALDWLRAQTGSADVTLSVCTGAFLVAEAGLLDGKSATTFHDAFDRFEHAFPAVKLLRGARFVDNGKLVTAGGLSSGIDAALHLVERMFGKQVAEQTAYDLEYQGRGLTDPKANSIYATPQPGATDPICGMRVDPKTAASSTYKGQRYYFCSSSEKQQFDAHPDAYLKKP